MRRTRIWTIALIAAFLVSSCDDANRTNHVEPRVLETIELPPAETEGRISLEEALAGRRSIREFTEEPLALEEISQLFWSAQGINRASGGRTNPSAGALYPIEVYAATEAGFFHYVPEEHQAEKLSADDVRNSLSEAAMGQEAVQDAAAVFVICGVFERTEARYGERAVRYVHLEAGHVGQSLLLQAAALGLGGVPIGAFEDGDVQSLLGLPADHDPLYLVAIGHGVDSAAGIDAS